MKKQSPFQKQLQHRIKKQLDHPKFLYTVISAAWQKFPPETSEALQAGFVLSWGIKGVGFGQLTFSQVPKKGVKKGKKSQKCQKGITLECYSENMGPEFVKQALAHWVSTMEVK